MSRTRTGKIARAPKEVRDQVNRMLNDGATGAAVIDYLTSQGITDVNDVNLTAWRQGGYQDWLKQGERLADMAAKREFAMEIVKSNQGSQLHEATLHLAASQLYEALEDFDVSAVKELLAEKPENYAAIVNSLAKLSKGALDVEKYKAQVREQKEKIEAALNMAKSKGGLTQDTLKQIEEAAAML